MNHLLPSEDRLQLMQKGAEQLHIWLSDIVRIGIIEHDFSADSLTEVSTRMVDAKMGSIGRRIRQFASLDRSDPGWTEVLKRELSLLYLFVVNFKKLPTQDLPMQMTLLTWAGYNIRKKDLNPDKGIKDVWYILGLTKRREEQLTIRRCWIVGLQSKRFATIIDYAFGRAKFDEEYAFDVGMQARLNYYPSSFPLRGALFSVQNTKLPPITFPGYQSFDVFLDQYAKALAKNPWLGAFPCTLHQVIPTYGGDAFFLVDREMKKMPLFGPSEMLWSIVVVAGGKGLSLFGEWNGYSLRPMSYLSSGKIIAVDPIAG